MTLYVDSSALVKRYVMEERSAEAEQALLSDPSWVTAVHTFVEVSLAFRKRLTGQQFAIARDAFGQDWLRTHVVAFDESLCRRAVELGSSADARSLDALHLAAAERAGGRSIPILTFDVRLARAARSLGFAVVGV